RFAIRVRQRNGLLVYTAGLAVDVGLVVVRIENLQLIPVVAGSSGGEKHATVAARLTASGDVRGDFPFNVKLVVFKAFLGFDVSSVLVHGHDAVVDFPFSRRLVLYRYPLIQILAIEQDDRAR